MEPIHFDKLVPIPENSFKKLASVTALAHDTTCVCPSCGKIVNATDYPYAYDPEENNIIFIAICPACGEAMYSHS